MSTKPYWTRIRVAEEWHELRGTYLALYPQLNIPGYWFVADSRDPEKGLTSGALLLKDAKQAAERLAPKYMKTPKVSP